MAKESGLLSRFDAALARLQPKPPDMISDRQKPILRRDDECGKMRVADSHLDALDDAATALSALWKIRR